MHRTTHTLGLLLVGAPLLTLAACKDELAIDRTLLSGTVVIPPGVYAEEGDDRDDVRDGWDQAVDLGTQTARWFRATGEARRFGPPKGNLEYYGDVDYYAFTAGSNPVLEVAFHFGGVVPPGPPPPSTGSTDTDTATGTPTDTGSVDTGLTGTTGDTGDTGDTGFGDTGSTGTLGDTGDTGTGVTRGDSGSGDTGSTGTSDTGTTASTGDTGTTGDTGDTGEPETLVYQVALVDLDDLDDQAVPADLVLLSTQGWDGLLNFSHDGLVAGTRYAILVAAVTNDEDQDPTYTLDISGLDPDSSGMVAGAYLPFDDALSPGDPVGGAAVHSWTLDRRSHTWTGVYEMMFLREVGETQQGDATVVTVTEGVDTVDLLAGDFGTINSGISAGALFNSEVPRVDLAAAEREEVELGASMGERVLMPDITLDTVAPKIVGWVEPEVEPNDVYTIYETYGLDPEALDQAQVLPVPSGPGFVDQVEGIMSFTEADPYWEYGDWDVYAFQVPEEMGARIYVGWPNGDVNLDLNFHDGDGNFYGAGWDVADANPEGFDSAGYLGHTFLPGETWYVSILGWEGPAGEHDYVLELEWLNP